MSRTIQAWLIAVVTALLLPAAAAHARSTTPQAGAAVTDGSVNAIAQIDGKTVLGGDFDYVGEATGAGVPFTRAGVPLASGYPRITGSVTTAVDDGSGGLFVSGSITAVGGIDTRNRWLVHIRSDGSFDSAWDPVIDSAPTRLVVAGSTLYAIGGFTTVGGQPRKRLAAIDATTGAVTSWAPVLGSGNTWSIGDLQLAGSTLYVGGSFTTVDGQPRAGLAAFDTTTGALSSWTVDLYSASVSALTTANGRLYVAGSLQRSSTDRFGVGLLAFDQATGARYAEWSPASSGGVYAMTARDGKIYIGGSFSRAGGEARRNLAAFDAEDGTLTPWNPGTDAYVTTLAVIDDSLVVGGNFLQVAGQDRLRIAAFDEDDLLRSWSEPAGGLVSAVVPVGRYVYVGGTFSSIGGTIRHNLVALDGDGRLLSWAPNPDNVVYALLADGTHVAVGGAFTTIAGQPRRGLAAFDTGGSLLSWAPQVDGQVYSFLAHGDAVYAGGWFRAIDGQTRSGIAAFDRSDGRLLPFAVDVSFGRNGGSAISGVRGLGVIGDTLYLGGLFEQVNGVTRSSLAAVDLRDGSLLPWDPEAIGDGRPIPQGRIYTLLAAGGTVYVGGAFRTGAGDQVNTAALDAVNGAKAMTLPTSGFATYALLLDGSTLYLQTDVLRAIDLTTGTALPWSVRLNGRANALTLTDGRLDAAGDFTTVGTDPVSGYARFLDD